MIYKNDRECFVVVFFLIFKNVICAAVDAG